MSGCGRRWWRRVVLCGLVVTGLVTAAPSLAQATALTEFSHGLTSPPASIAAGPDRNVRFTESHAIGRITPSGTITEYGTANGLDSGSMVYGSIVAGSDGDMWFSDDGTIRAIGRITPAGVITEYGTADGLNAGAVPENLTLGPDGNVWFIDNGATPAIGRVTPSGAINEYSSHLNPLSQPNDITAGAGGSLWFTDQGGMSPAIGRATTAGVISEFDLSASSFPNEITPGAALA
jgi:virginiamycin B lyase